MAQPLRGVRLKQVNSIDIGDDEPNVDIIAIHGLDTKSPDTWTWRAKDSNEPSVNWLSDSNMLPAKMKRVRIFTCDWPADLLQDSDSVPWTVEEFARRLLTGILDMRLPLAADARSRDRPILFIASCLGGIILMKALVMADRPESDYYAIRKATRGIVFLATPFRGTSFQDIAAWVEPMLKTWASLRNRSVAQLLNSVKGSTYELEQLVRTFTRLCQDTEHPCKVHTFLRNTYDNPSEQGLTGGSSAVAWSVEASTLDIDSDPLPLERRHVMMNKFCGPHDADYETVIGRLDALLQMVRNGPLQQADAWIRDKHYTADRLRIQRLSGQLLPMDQCYINLVIVERPGGSTQKSKETRSSPFSFFARQKLEAPDDKSQIELSTIFNERKGHDGNPMQPRRILIRGRAGVGKTTLCKKIIHEFQRCTWTQWNTIFDRILWVPLRNLKIDERKRPGYNYECLLSDEYFSLPESKPKLARELAKALATKNSKTLFLLDGLDEVSQLMVGEGSMALFLRDHLLKQPNVIITSRPSAKSLPGMDLELETIGFYEEQVEAYLNADPGIEPKVNEVKSFLKQHWLLQGLVRIPVQLDALCYTWSDFDSGTSPETMTAIYQAIEQKLWRKDAVRLGRMTQDEAESSHCPEIEDKVESEVHLLECLAFAGMHSDVLDYTSAHREKALRAWRSLSKAHALALPLDETLGRLSFLRSSDSSTRSKDKSYHFIHLTFQEYFAARYFVHQWSSREPLCALELGTQEKGSMKELDAESFLRREKYNARYDIFWRFVTGLLHAGKDEDKLCRFFRLIEDQPRDLLGPVHQRLIMHCLSEVSSSDGSASFALLRKRLEHRLAQWLKFDCEFLRKHSEFRISGIGAHLVREVDFPEKGLNEGLNDILEGASEDAKNGVLWALRTRPRLPRSTIELMTSRVESEDMHSTWLHFFLLIIFSHNDLPIRTLNALIRCIDHGDFSDQNNAVNALRAQGTLPEEIRDILASRVKNGDLNFQRGAVVTLSGLPLESAIDRIVAQLDHPDDEHRRHALRSLWHDQEFVGYVIQAVAARLEDQHQDIRKSALSVLESQGTLPQDVIKLVVAHLGDADEHFRVKLLRVLRRQQPLPEDILKDLVAQLQVHDKYTQVAALKVLRDTSIISENVMKTLATLVATRDDILQIVINKDILRYSSNLQEGLLRIAVHWITDENIHMQSVAFQLLAATDDLPGDVIASMSGLLQSHDEAIKLKILSLFSRQHEIPTEVLKMVSAQLEHRSKRITRAALNVLVSCCQGTQGLPLDVRWALAALLTDEDTGIKCKVLEALSGPSKLPNNILSAIVSQFKDPYQPMTTRCDALSALRKQPYLSAEIVSEIAEQLQDRDAAIRQQAALTLTGQPTLPQGVLKALAGQLEHDDEHVRLAAAEALRNRSLSEDILDAIASRLADPDGSARRAALKALESKPDLPQSIVKAVLRNLSDEDRHIRQGTIHLLVNQASLIPEVLHVLASRLKLLPADEKVEILVYLQHYPTLSHEILHIVASQLNNLSMDFMQDEDIRQAAMKVFRCQSALPDIILKKTTLYHTWLKQSFSEHVSCYVLDGVAYLDMPDGLGKVALKGNSDEFMEAMLEVQKEVGVPLQMVDLDS